LFDVAHPVGPLAEALTGDRTARPCGNARKLPIASRRTFGAAATARAGGIGLGLVAAAQPARPATPLLSGLPVRLAGLIGFLTATALLLGIASLAGLLVSLGLPAFGPAGLGLLAAGLSFLAGLLPLPAFTARLTALAPSPFLGRLACPF